MKRNDTEIIISQYPKMKLSVAIAKRGTQMSEKIAIEVIGRLPASIIIYILLSGAILLLLSPIRLFFSPLINPFLLGEYSLDNLIIFTILCLIAGSPIFLLKDIISGNKGLNEIIGNIWRIYKKQERTNKTTESLTYADLKIKTTELADFTTWSKQTGLHRELEFISIEAHTVTALINTAEICILLNILALGFYFKILVSFFYPTFNCNQIWINLAISFSIGITSYIFEREYFRKWKEKRLNQIGKGFRDSNKIGFSLNSGLLVS